MTSIIKIGATAGTVTALDALATPVKDPASVSFYPYSEIIQANDGYTISRGKPYCVLYWKNILRTQRDQLRTFCTGASALAYWELPTNDTNLTTDAYSGIMTWPLKETYYLNILTDFSITIYNLVAT